MSLISVILVVAVVSLAYVNGANDNFKGVATLFGSKTTSYRTAVLWALVTTFAGAIVALFVGTALIKAFSGKGLVEIETLRDPYFLLSVCLAAAATVFLATRIGFPISTTHAIVGGLVGAGLASPGGVELVLLGSRFLLPLISAPILAIVLTLTLYQFFRFIRLRFDVQRETCLCVGEVERVVAVESQNLAVSQAINGDILVTDGAGAVRVESGFDVAVGEVPSCHQRYVGNVIGIRADTAINALHFLTAGAVGFARGLQDTAKIVGLLVGASIVGLGDQNSLLWGVTLVAVAMGLGGVLSARNVADTLSQGITEMNHGQGFTANLVTSALVISSGLFGLGVSTTHCSVGALFGIGISNGTARWEMIRQIVLAWVITLPCAAVLAFTMFSLKP